MRPTAVLGVDGVAAARLQLAEQPAVRVIALTSFGGRQQVDDALAAGAIGYLLKDSTPEVLFDAVRPAAAGPSPLDPRLAAALLPSRPPPPASLLSARETEVLRLAAKGLANKQIGRTLGISEHAGRSTSATCSAGSGSATGSRPSAGPAHLPPAAPRRAP